MVQSSYERCSDFLRGKRLSSASAVPKGYRERKIARLTLIALMSGMVSGCTDKVFSDCTLTALRLKDSCPSAQQAQPKTNGGWAAHTEGSQELSTVALTPPPHADADTLEAEIKSFAKSSTRLDQPSERIALIRQRGKLGLPELTRLTILRSPRIGISKARVLGASLGLDVAKIAYLPQIAVTLTSGQNFTGTYQNSSLSSYADLVRGALQDSGGVVAKQLIYDFGVTKHDIARANAILNSEELKSLDEIEAVTLELSNAYLKILEQRELIALAIENNDALNQLSELVVATQKGGAGTLADVKRVKTRLTDSQAARQDAESELLSGADDFRRLTGIEPIGLGNPPQLTRSVPESEWKAVEEGVAQNPAILALQAAGRSFGEQGKSTAAQYLPRLSAQYIGNATKYSGLRERTDLNTTGMAVLNVPIYDGGLLARQADQFHAQELEQNFKAEDTRQLLEVQIRQFYNQIRASREKLAILNEGLSAAEKSKELFFAQFKEGSKRTLFELLDVQTTYYNAKKAEINNRYNEQRAMFNVLRSIGRLTRAITAPK